MENSVALIFKKIRVLFGVCVSVLQFLLAARFLQVYKNSTNFCLLCGKEFCMLN
jgi:hypothetical protein